MAHTRVDETLALRKATKADLDDLTEIAQQGFPDDPEFNYRFPYRHEYPQDNWKWVRREYEEYLNQPQKYAVLVGTLRTTVKNSLGGDSHVTKSKPIALAVWDISVLTPSQGSDLGLHERRDANPVHMKEFEKTLEQAFTDYFSHYGENQIHLWLLCTHPDFRRRGAGTLLCKWGMDLAVQKGWVATVMASEMGRNLYEHLGFQVLGSVVVQAEGEQERLVVWCLELPVDERCDSPGWFLSCYHTVHAWMRRIAPSW